MPAWIHDRAMSMKKDMEETYGPEKAKQVAFAVATQQAHRLGKSPKTFKSKVTGEKERFGTPEGRAVAKAKFDKPKREYQKTAAETSLETNEPSVAGAMPDGTSAGQDYPTNVGSPNPVNVRQDLGPLFSNKTETHQGKETQLNSIESSTPTIKTAMYSGFFDEFVKIAKWSPQLRVGGKELKRRAGHLMERTGYKLPRGEAEESVKAVVQSARKKLPWHTRAAQAIKREEHPSVIRALREHTGRV